MRHELRLQSPVALAAPLYAVRIAAPAWGRVATSGIGTSCGARSPQYSEYWIDIAAIGGAKRLGRAVVW